SGMAALDVEISVDRVPSRAPATAKFASLFGASAVEFTCRFESPRFRKVHLEVDVVAGVTPFRSYLTSAAPEFIGPARELTVFKAFREAGIQMLRTSTTTAVPIAE